MFNAKNEKNTNEEKNQRDVTCSYAEFSSQYVNYLGQSNKSKQEIKNTSTAVKTWCQSLEIDLDKPPAEEFDKEFERCIKKFIKFQSEKGLAQSTYYSRVSIIRNFRKFCAKQSNYNSLPDEFGERIKYLLKLNDYTRRKFWQHHLSKLIKYNTFLLWSKGINKPHRNNYPVVEIIERELSLKPGTLLSSLTKLVPSEKEETSYTERLKLIIQKKYRILTENLQKELDDLTIFKTSVVPPFGMKRQSGAMWTRNTTTGDYQSLSLSKSWLTAFLGFCHLPKDNFDPQLIGLGLDKETLSMALLAEAEMVEQFITVFRLSRTDGKYNNFEIHFLTLVISLLRPEFGYLYQKSELGTKSGLANNKKSWQSKCVNTRNRLIEIRKFIEYEKKSGGSGFRLGRDPKERIKEILESKRPLFTLLKLSDAISEDIKKLITAPLSQAVLYRDMLLVKLLANIPLRVCMMSFMKLGQHLIKKDGAWWIEFKRDDFKNRRFLDGDFSVKVSPEIWKTIEEYLETYRPRLFGADKYSNVFLPASGRFKEGAEYAITPETLSNRIYDRSRQYIEGNSGFRIHSFRHIVASDIVKFDPVSGCQLAAITLHDNVETVKGNYAHLITNDYFKAYNDYFSKTLNSFKSDGDNLQNKKSGKGDTDEEAQF